MSLKKYLLAGGLSTVLLLAACGGADSSEEDGTEENSGEETSEDSGNDESTDVSYSGQYGEYNVLDFSQYSIEPPEGENEEETSEGEETGPTEVVVIEFEFTNNSDVATAPQEAFGLDLAVRQMDGDSEVPLDNLTMDLPEDYEKSEEATAATEMIDPGESATAVVAYGPLDPELETVLQSRENPMAEESSEPLDHTIELEGSSEE
ncbi:hypothetical protein [Salinicoccus halodurans]|uniref:DUF5067 domain-containing protein n=1 Tax=Salinicoccus halodurans TaxID=407035 RepID=A0A0F7HMW6_9STAP|nr:hypothetical protein [Salinicoccus halodurans]AKG74344.1 hypothetical protein AAT16_08920 [Salinicoccus halodurans]SFK94788.1 hypothetical protein SAMN05216235_2681 [Salinicoccus halodurans]